MDDGLAVAGQQGSLLFAGTTVDVLVPAAASAGALSLLRM